jgi:hypothetical protein
MINLKKIGIMILALGMATGFAQAAGPDATLQLSGGTFALGIGFNWAKGTLTYKGKDYPVKVKGLSVGRVGATGVNASGEVFNLKHLKDFNGHYDYSGAGGVRGVTVANGHAGAVMQNQAGTIIRLSTSQKGLDVNATGGGVDMQIVR